MRTLSNFCLIILVFFVMTAGFPDVSAAKPIRVAVIPFKINAEKDMSFLRDGIFDMFAFRLSRDGRVEVINREDVENAAKSFKGTLNEHRVRDIGSKLNADYALFGNITVFGNSVSINAKMTDVTGKKPSLVFFDQTRKLDEVVPKISQFAIDMNKKMFGQQQVVSEAVPVPPQPVLSNMPAKPKKHVRDKAPNPAFIMSQTRKTSEELWKSKPFGDIINGMALGDVDGDGKIETVMITRDTVHIYRAENGRFHKVKEIKEQHKNFIGTDIADINGNGYPEIFITSLNVQRSGVRSLVFEWNGRDYVKIVKKSGWYYKVVDLPGQGNTLLGQKNTSANPFSGKIFEMTWQDSDYVPGKQVAASKRHNLMGFTMGDVKGNGQTLAVAYNEEDYICITDPLSGHVLWKGREKHGGSMRYYLMPKTERGTDNRKYLPMRVLIRDIDGDGKNEVMTTRNHDIAQNLLKAFRKFTDAQVESLFWDGIGLAVNWKTQKISGHISDFAVGDFDNDGMNELVASVIIKEGGIIGTSPESMVVAYDLK